MSPESASLTQNAVETAVNNELQNHQIVGTATATGDGISTIFVVAPLGYYLVSGTLTITLNGSPTSAWTADYSNGTVTFTNAPGNNVAIIFNFKYVQFYSSVVTEAVNAALFASFPYFYDTVTQSITTDATTTEYSLTSGTSEAVTAVYLNTSTNYILVPRRKYEVYDVGLVKWLRFYTAPAAGTMRVHSVARPSITSIPDRAKSALVSYACYYLLTQKMAPRARGDVAVVTQGTGTLSPRQMNDAAQAFLMRNQIQLQQSRMSPWSVH